MAFKVFVAAKMLIVGFCSITLVSGCQYYRGMCTFMLGV
jgi:hypothetical protein